ncbi:galactose-6-phosphate isomerase subunit LacA [Lentibacillus cibarius]|uniref:Galactose-6-phosphate isomerase subunit LacA n=1 Tax=Lentibacillus cibarius TaxID=2583219 RepID=A0A549YEW6_9BACI|nr:galactose-6-phosphate isomerase subunit LacA [Lentibacillus cibarius]TMN21489.1 galactose-6-phosphate isomerase subunit LacA [Lentibacillus cibarius]TRM10387.1 galactose-6-phosphate isomerase subunit LacA [Lentibacillus cibarius]
MKVAIGNDSNGIELKEHLKAHVEELGYEVIDSTPDKDFNLFEAATEISKVVNEGKADRGIVIDEYGVGSFMVANKYKGIVCANVFDEHSAKMTVRHNNASIITIGSGIVGKKLAEKICESFLHAEYDGGRHQIRVDMLNKMC